MTTKEKIIDLLKGVKRNGIDNVIRFLEESTYFKVGCHRHHKYEGGLAKHSLEVCESMLAYPGLDRDSAILVGLLHDVGTAKHKDCFGIKGHGRRSLAIVENKCGLELTKEEREAIREHMHPYNNLGNKYLRGIGVCDSLSAMFGSGANA